MFAFGSVFGPATGDGIDTKEVWGVGWRNCIGTGRRHRGNGNKTEVVVVKNEPDYVVEGLRTEVRG